MKRFFVANHRAELLTQRDDAAKASGVEHGQLNKETNFSIALSEIAKGGSVVSQVVDAMKVINDSSRMIADIIGD